MQSDWSYKNSPRKSAILGQLMNDNAVPTAATYSVRELS